MAYPDFDFSSLLEDDDDTVEPEKMAEAIQALIDLLGQEILMYDMSHISGDEIVNGNPEHCINLLQILQQISSASMMQDDESEKQESSNQQRQMRSPPKSGGKSSSKKRTGEMNELFAGDSNGNKQQLLDNLDDDRVGEIENLSQQLDIEFDGELGRDDDDREVDHNEVDLDD